MPRGHDVRQTANRLQAGAGFPESAYQQALATRERLRAAYTAALRPPGGPVDALIYPTVRLPAPPLGTGLPVGISLEALPGGDAALLAVARRVEALIAAR